MKLGETVEVVILAMRMTTLLTGCRIRLYRSQNRKCLLKIEGLKSYRATGKKPLWQRIHCPGYGYDINLCR